VFDGCGLDADGAPAGRASAQARQTLRTERTHVLSIGPDG
jgi:hypothetical protein